MLSDFHQVNTDREMPTENPYQPPDSRVRYSRGRISMVTMILALVFLLIFGFAAYESTRMVLAGFAPIAMNICVFYFPILCVLGWYVRKRVLRELASEHESDTQT